MVAGSAGGQDEADDERLDIAEALVLEKQDDQHVASGQRDAPDERQAEKQIEGDGRAEHFGEIAGGDGNLAEDPQPDDGGSRIAVPARLREIAATGDPEPGGERLKQDRHQVRRHDDAEKRVTVTRAPRQVGRPIAGIHVADGDKVAGAGKRKKLAPEARAAGDCNGTVDFGQADAGRRQAPAARGSRWSFPSHYRNF